MVKLSWRHRTVTLLYLGLGLALFGVTLALAWVGGLPDSSLAAAPLPPLGALLLWWGVVRVEAERRSSAYSATSADQS